MEGRELVFTFYETIDMPREAQALLVDGEHAVAVFRTLRDYALFTNKRIVIADKQGLTGKKVEYYTIPYRSIVMYSKENAGMLDLDAELELVLTGGIHCKFKFLRGKGVQNQMDLAYQIISQYLLPG